jgi:phosphomannomutase
MPGSSKLTKRNWRNTVVTEEQGEIVLSSQHMEEENLLEWAEAFKLGTAGYRDQLDLDDIDNPKVAFNRTKVAVIAEAKARVYDRLSRDKGGKIERHVGGEVRPHTKEFIELAARIYAAHGHKVHLRKGVDTTPIWYSSFGVFYNELNDGENFTASHSPSFKGGWKPMDGMGKQLLEEADLIADEVRRVVTPGYVIRLAPKETPLIVRDFDATEAYLEYLRSIIPEQAIRQIREAQEKGFLTFISTLGGSMAKTTRPIFEELGIDRGIRFMHEEEDANYHGLGILNGVNYGADPGKWQIYKNVGAQKILKETEPGNVFFIWDPDGDRFNMISTAPSGIKEKAMAYGLEVDGLSQERVLVYFKPNQIYFMLAILRILQMKETGDLDRFDWLVAETFPTSRSIGEVAEKYNLKVVRTPVGFKYFGEVLEQIETQLDHGGNDIGIQTPTGESISLGRRPRILIMAEESGGAAMGGVRLAVSKGGLRKSLAMKEKDGFQIGLAVMALAARLYLQKEALAEFYMKSVDENDIAYRYYERLDVTLYDENLPPDKLAAAKQEGIAKRERVVDFFRSLADRPLKEVESLLGKKMPHVNLPRLRKVMWAGDGTLLDFEGMWWEIRASGTDAVLRYYIEGRARESILAINRAFSEMEI